MFSQAIGRLQDAAGAAATTVLKIMLDTNAPAATRLRAAEIVLEQAAKAGEIEDIEDRVAKLERTAGSPENSRKRSADLTWLSATPLPDAGYNAGRRSRRRASDSAETGRGCRRVTPWQNQISHSADELVDSPSSRISVLEIARRLNIGRLAVYSMLEQGIIPGLRLGRRWIITRQAYLTWESTCGLRRALDFQRQPEVDVVN